MQFPVSLVLIVAVIQLKVHGAPKILLNKRVAPTLKQEDPYYNPAQGQTLAYNNAITNYAKTEFGNCAKIPRISIISYSRDEFVPNETLKTELLDITGEDGKVWMAPFAATVEIECQARVPIQWIFDGPHVSSISDQMRHINQKWPAVSSE